MELEQRKNEKYAKTKHTIQWMMEREDTLFESILTIDVNMKVYGQTLNNQQIFFFTRTLIVIVKILFIPFNNNISEKNLLLTLSEQNPFCFFFSSSVCAILLWTYADERTLKVFYDEICVKNCWTKCGKECKKNIKEKFKRCCCTECEYNPLIRRKSRWFMWKENASSVSAQWKFVCFFH